VPPEGLKTTYSYRGIRELAVETTVGSYVACEQVIGWGSAYQGLTFKRLAQKSGMVAAAVNTFAYKNKVGEKYYYVEKLDKVPDPVEIPPYSPIRPCGEEDGPEMMEPGMDVGMNSGMGPDMGSGMMDAGMEPGMDVGMNSGMGPDMGSGMMVQPTASR